MTTLSTIEHKIFDRRYEWEKIDREVALRDTHVLDLVREACLVEAYFGVYTGKMITLFWYDIEATSTFAIEAFEAYTHYYTLKRYLDTVGYKPVTDEEIQELRRKNLDTVYTDEIRELVNFMATEHFAARFFSDLGEAAQEPILKTILPRLSLEEVNHARFAFDLLHKRLKKNPELRNIILDYASTFQHVGAYALPVVSRVKEDNLQIIQEFNTMLEELTQTSVSDYLATKQ
jgi:hypothetical protein